MQEGGSVEFIKKGFNLKPGSEAAYRNASQLIGAMISNEMIDRDEGEDYLEELRESIQEDLQGKVPVQQFPTMDDIGITEEQPQQLATQPTLPTPNLTTPNVNPTLLNQAPTGIATLNQGLTPSESAFLREEDKQIRLRQRGLA